MDSKELGAFLKSYRNSLKLSQRQIGEVLNLSKTTYGNIERGKITLFAEQRNTLFRLLGIVPHEQKLPEQERPEQEPAMAPVFNQYIHISKWWRWLIYYAIWEAVYTSVARESSGQPLGFYIMSFIIACAPLAFLSWFWPAPWPFTIERREIIRNWRIWPILAKVWARIKKEYNE